MRLPAEGVEIETTDVVEDLVLNGHGVPLGRLGDFQPSGPVDPLPAGGRNRLRDGHVGEARSRVHARLDVGERRVGPEARLDRRAEADLDLGTSLFQRPIVAAGEFLNGLQRQRLARVARASASTVAFMLGGTGGIGGGGM